MTITKICNIRPDYAVFGCGALSDHGMEVYDQLISKRLPSGVIWCGDELCRDINDEIDEFDLDEIISEAGEDLLSMDDESLWEC